MNDSILNGAGLRGALENRRVMCQRRYFELSHVVFDGPRLVGHIFSEDKFNRFLETSYVVKKELLKNFWDKYSVPFGTGYRAMPAELTDVVLDMASGVV